MSHVYAYSLSLWLGACPPLLETSSNASHKSERAGVECSLREHGEGTRALERAGRAGGSPQSIGNLNLLISQGGTRLRFPLRGLARAPTGFTIMRYRFSSATPFVPIRLPPPSRPTFLFQIFHLPRYILLPCSSRSLGMDQRRTTVARHIVPAAIDSFFSLFSFFFLLLSRLRDFTHRGITSRISASIFRVLF